MQHVLKAGLAVAALLGSASAAVAAPASQLLALNQPTSAVKRTALPTCSRTVTANCSVRGSRVIGPTGLIIAGVALAAGVTAAATASHSSGSNSASP